MSEFTPVLPVGFGTAVERHEGVDRSGGRAREVPGRTCGMAWPGRGSG